jgi:hypothetical protein
LNNEGELTIAGAPPRMAGGLGGWLWRWWPWPYTGVYTWTNGDRYEGTWLYSMPNGHGVLWD